MSVAKEMDSKLMTSGATNSAVPISFRLSALGVRTSANPMSISLMREEFLFTSMMFSGCDEGEGRGGEGRGEVSWEEEEEKEVEAEEEEGRVQIEREQKKEEERVREKILS